MIGERCNVAGSSIYKKAIVDGNYDKAASIATKQVGMNSQIDSTRWDDMIWYDMMWCDMIWYMKI